jgi:hypothetical protein
MRCCVRCSPISRSTSSPEVGSYNPSQIRRDGPVHPFMGNGQPGPHCLFRWLATTQYQYKNAETCTNAPHDLPLESHMPSTTYCVA